MKPPAVCTAHPATFLLALALLGASPLGAAEIEGVHFDDALQLDTTPLALRGAGLLRYRVLFRGYVAALYLPREVPSDAALEDVPRRLEIEYFWSIPADGFRDATLQGIAAGARERFAEEIAQLNALYRDVEPGDRYALSYHPERGTELALNGAALGSVAGRDFSAALFAIWLGDAPLDEGLREQLLRGP